MDHRDTEDTEDAQRVELGIAETFMNTLSVYVVSVCLFVSVSLCHFRALGASVVNPCPQKTNVGEKAHRGCAEIFGPEQYTSRSNC
jgi:hypothetical protein